MVWHFASPTRFSIQDSQVGMGNKQDSPDPIDMPAGNDEPAQTAFYEVLQPTGLTGTNLDTPHCPRIRLLYAIPKPHF